MPVKQVEVKFMKDELELMLKGSYSTVARKLGVSDALVGRIAKGIGWEGVR